MVKDLIARAEKYAEEAMRHDCTGHDHLHAERVRRTALALLRAENSTADAELVELVALLHDIGDAKLKSAAPSLRPSAGELVRQWGGVDALSARVESAIAEIGFKGGFNAPPTTLEAQLVQDADRLDALGAVGIARAFAYGGHIGQKPFDPSVPVRTFATEREYRQCSGTTANHFHEKLFRLPALLHTATAKRLAEDRVAFMREFLLRLEEECAETPAPPHTGEQQ